MKIHTLKFINFIIKLQTKVIILNLNYFTIKLL